MLHFSFVVIPPGLLHLRVWRAFMHLSVFAYVYGWMHALICAVSVHMVSLCN